MGREGRALLTEIGLALLHERCDSLLPVRCYSCPSNLPSLQLHLLLQAIAQRTEQQLFHDRLGQRWTRCELAADGLSLSIQSSVRHDAGDQPPIRSFDRRKRPVGEREFLCPAQADEPRKI